MSRPAKTWTGVKGSCKIIKAKKAPKREAVENIIPVRIEPISLRPTMKNRIEKPILNAPTDIR